MQSKLGYLIQAGAVSSEQSQCWTVLLLNLNEGKWFWIIKFWELPAVMWLISMLQSLFRGGGSTHGQYNQSPHP